MAYRGNLGIPGDDFNKELHRLHPPARATSTACLFYRSQILTLKQLLYGRGQLQEILNLTKTLELIRHALVGDDDDYEHAIRAIGLEDLASEDGDEMKDVFKRVNFYRDWSNGLAGIQRQMVVTREVDNLLGYLADIAAEIHVRRPETLRSGEQVSLEDVLRHGSLQEFTRWATERRISDLSFKGFRDLVNYFNKSFAFDAEFSDPLWRSLTQAVAIRNIFVHRRGVADERFIRIMRDQNLKPGDPYRLDADEVLEILIATHRAVRHVDDWAIKKFTIEVVDTDESLWWSPLSVPQAK